MIIHTGERYQTGRGLGSLFSGLFRSLKPLVAMGLKTGKKILTSDVVRSIGSAALDIGKDTLRNVAADIIEGKDVNDSLNKGLETAKSTISSQIRGAGRKRKKKVCHSKISSKHGRYSLLDN